jgi:nicotinate-nucleotide--dimethylbenzimidazole phosphoribosyltransferase
MGGLEIAAMVGAALHAAANGMLVIVDGYIATAAALVADRIDTAARRAFVFAHRGAEPGHAIALAALGAHPLLALELRLGEGSGAALALPLAQAAARMLSEMATFDSAGVSGAEGA